MLIANESSKLVFIVDNGPWTSKEYRSRPAELWQLMVTQVTFPPPLHICLSVFPCKILELGQKSFHDNAYLKACSLVL